MPFPSNERKHAHPQKQRDSRKQGKNGVASSTQHLSPWDSVSKTISKVKKAFKHQPSVIDDWLAFGRAFPQTSSAEEYVRETDGVFKTPLHDYLTGQMSERVNRMRGIVATSASLGSVHDGVGTSQVITEADGVISGVSLFEEDTMIQAVAQESVVIGNRPKNASDGLQPLRLEPHDLLQGLEFIEGDSARVAAQRRQQPRSATVQRNHETEDLKSLNNNELKALVKSLNGKGYSKLNKTALIALVDQLREMAAPIPPVYGHVADGDDHRNNNDAAVAVEEAVLVGAGEVDLREVEDEIAAVPAASVALNEASDNDDAADDSGVDESELSDEEEEDPPLEYDNLYSLTRSKLQSMVASLDATVTGYLTLTKSALVALVVKLREASRQQTEDTIHGGHVFRKEGNEDAVEGADDESDSDDAVEGADDESDSDDAVEGADDESDSDDAVEGADDEAEMLIKRRRRFR
jgi:hypothetical protein